MASSWEELTRREAAVYTYNIQMFSWVDGIRLFHRQIILGECSQNPPFFEFHSSISRAQGVFGQQAMNFRHTARLCT